jgi:hypothetical protein
VFFGLRGITEHHQMRWGYVKLCNDNKGDEYLLMIERNTKTRIGIDIKNQGEIPQRAWANKDDPSRCAVAAYKLYRSKSPIKYCNPDDPFMYTVITCICCNCFHEFAKFVDSNRLGPEP